MKSKYEKELSIAIQAATKAGDRIKVLQQTSTLTISTKSTEFDLVTSGDFESENIVVSAIKEEFPSHLIFSEEFHSKIDYQKLWEEPSWIIDPIDGTVNYAHGCLHVCVAIAFAEAGEVKVGVVYSPFLNELFTAVKGEGSFLNNVPIKTSICTELKRALVSTGEPYNRAPLMDKLIAGNRALLENCAGIRRAGAAAIDIAWVACGRLDAHFEHGLNAWDVAAANLIAKEAGAACGHLRGNTDQEHLPPDMRGNHSLISAPGIFKKLQELLPSAE